MIGSIIGPSKLERGVLPSILEQIEDIDEAIGMLT